MNNTRKKIILNEILYWKQTRILPEKYCNYLLALYSEGDAEQQVPTQPIKRKGNIFLPEVLISFILLSALIVNYFTEIKSVMQMSLFAFFICLLLGITYYHFRMKKSLFIPLIATAFVILLMSVRAWELLFHEQVLFLYGILFGNCLAWFIVGRRLQYLYFTIAGSLGTLVILYFVGLYFGIF